MAERVGAHAQARSGLACVAANDAIDAASRQSGALIVEKQRIGGWLPPLPRALKGRATAILQVQLDRLGRRVVERHDSFFSALTRHARDAAGQVHVFEIESDQLTQ